MRNLKENLSSNGDIREIAQITGYNESYVRKVINGERKNEIIIQVANDLVTMRKALYQKYAQAHKQNNKTS